MAFANAKVLLFGEHAVVHGEPAIAAGLGIGVRARVVPGPPLLRCDAWGLAALPGDGSKVGAAFDALLRALAPNVPPAAVELDADIPAGAGLGSSAAMAVAAARALAEATGVALTDAHLYDAALASERVFHGNPSGLDHAVAMRGGLVRFVRGTPPTIDTLTAPVPFPLVVARVSPGADTGRMVAAVTAQRERLGAVGAGLHRLIGDVVRAAESAIRDGDLATVGELMNVNHGLLAAIGVSTAELDAACHAARSAGALGAKLTGAGGGGCVVALVPATARDAVTAALDDLGADVYPATVG